MQNLLFQSDLGRFRSMIAELDRQPVQQVLFYSKGKLNSDVTPAKWRSKMIYAFVASNACQTIFRLGYTRNPLNRLSPRHARNTLGHPNFIEVQLLDPDVEVYGFIVKKLTTEMELIPYFNPTLNNDGNQIKKAERHRDNLLTIYDFICNNRGCDTSAISRAAGVGSTAANIYANQLKNMGLITIEAGRSKMNRLKWIHGIPPMQ